MDFHQTAWTAWIGLSVSRKCQYLVWREQQGHNKCSFISRQRWRLCTDLAGKVFVWPISNITTVQCNLSRSLLERKYEQTARRWSHPSQEVDWWCCLDHLVSDGSFVWRTSSPPPNQKGHRLQEGVQRVKDTPRSPGTFGCTKRTCNNS